MFQLLLFSSYKMIIIMKTMLVEFRECKNTLYPPHCQNQNHGFNFWFWFPFFCRFPRKKWVLFREKWFYLGFQVFPQRRGWGVFASFEEHELDLWQCPSTVWPVSRVLVFQLSQQQNRTQRTFSTVPGTPPSRTRTKGFPPNF